MPTTLLRRTLAGVSIGWVALLPLAPFAASRPAPADVWYGLAFGLYAAGSMICHQLPERSFQLWAAQLPVCARCTGIYVGAAVAALAAAVWPCAHTVRLGQAAPRLRVDRAAVFSRTAVDRARVLLAVAVLPTVLTLLYEWTTGDTPSNVVRCLAGAPLGAAAAFLVMSSVG